MRTILSVLAVSTLAAFMMFAQAPPQGKGGGGGGGGKAAPKNLKVLTPDNFRAAMQGFVAGLGLADKGGCGYCHVADKSSDENPMKVKARMMLMMVADINKAFGDGKEHVTCFTCHRGSTAPLTAPPQ